MNELFVCLFLKQKSHSSKKSLKKRALITQTLCSFLYTHQIAMELFDKNTDQLLDNIRKELTTIIENSTADNKPKSVISTVVSDQGDCSAKKHLGKVDLPSQLAASEIIDKKPEEERTAAAIAAAAATYVDPQSTPTLDADLLNMQQDLQQSYELFQTIGDKFKSINFCTLKQRIRNLQLSEKQKDTTLRDDVRAMLDGSYHGNRLNSLTAEMTHKFNQHPGEFGDIPELSEFFKACTQLQHGLEQIKRQRTDVGELGQRMCSAAGAAYERVDKIRCSMGAQIQKQ